MVAWGIRHNRPLPILINTTCESFSPKYIGVDQPGLIVLAIQRQCLRLCQKTLANTIFSSHVLMCTHSSRGIPSHKGRAQHLLLGIHLGQNHSVGTMAVMAANFQRLVIYYGTSASDQGLRQGLTVLVVVLNSQGVRPVLIISSTPSASLDDLPLAESIMNNEHLTMKRKLHGLT